LAVRATDSASNVGAWVPAGLSFRFSRTIPCRSGKLHPHRDRRFAGGDRVARIWVGAVSVENGKKGLGYVFALNIRTSLVPLSPSAAYPLPASASCIPFFGQVIVITIGTYFVETGSF